MLPHSSLRSHPTLTATWKHCKYAFDKCGISPLPSPLLPILDHPKFIHRKRDETLRTLTSIDTCLAFHFIQDLEWLTTQQMASDPSFSSIGPSQILHILKYLSTLPSATLFERPLTTFEQICQDKGPFPQALSFSYKLLLSVANKISSKIYV